MEFATVPIIAGAVVLTIGVILSFIILSLRRVVATNEVHIVQTRKTTTSYGKDQTGGNTYYEWPSWLPIIGLTKIVLPVSVFSLELNAYEAYDKERVPFVADIMAFFRIDDPNTAAQRVHSFEDLEEQLTGVLQGAARTILASNEIDTIMLERSKFGDQFTIEVGEQLKSWGVVTVKNIELMDIRDAAKSQVIHNIMAKRTSAIEMESRLVVAENTRKAESAEIEARRDVELQKQQAAQQVGQRTAEKDKAIGIANEQAAQEVKTQQRETKVREMAVVEVQSIRTAEIEKGVKIVKAEEQKQTSLINADAQKQTDVIKAEGDKQKTILVAEGQLEAKTREAKGVEVEGLARAAAEKAMQLAPIEAQIVLAQEIGENEGYQKYLINVKQVDAAQQVGIAQASALEKAEVKIIANTGDPVSGVTNVLDLFSAKGGTSIGAMLEGLKQTEAGKAVIDALTPAAPPAIGPAVKARVSTNGNGTTKQ